MRLKMYLGCNYVKAALTVRHSSIYNFRIRKDVYYAGNCRNFI